MGTRLKHRIPVRLRHYWRPVGALAIFLAVTLGIFGNVQMRPYIMSAERNKGDVAIENIAGGTDIFDSAVAHTVTIQFTDDDYQRMLDAYFDESEKEYVEADVIIDGTSIPSVGLRLKGNSTLAGLRDPNRTEEETATRPGGPGGPAQGQGRPGGGGGMSMTSLSVDKPEDLPWLMSFDEYVEGRRYQGHQSIAVRPSSGQTPTVMNEALALSLTATAGEPVQKFAYSSFTVNDRPSVTRLLVENPGDSFVESAFDSDGVLYKALSTGQFTDQGNDQTDYQDDFDQINLKGSQDLQPVIDLIQWVHSGSDQDFEKNLSERVDVQSLARYLALQNLLLNFDDMSGPGKNYYLWYDLDAEKFSVVTWDLNLTFSGDAGQKPDESGGFGRMGGGGGEPPEGFQPPEGFEPPGDGDAAGPGGNAGGGRMMTGNKLKERFLATPAFKAVYHTEYKALYQKLYADGTALSTIDELSTALKKSGAKSATVDSDAEKLRTLVRNRTTALATDDVITR